MIYLSRTPHGVRGLKFKAVIAEGIIETIKKVADELFPHRASNQATLKEGAKASSFLIQYITC